MSHVFILSAPTRIPAYGAKSLSYWRSTSGLAIIAQGEVNRWGRRLRAIGIASSSTDARQRDAAVGLGQAQAHHTGAPDYQATEDTTNAGSMDMNKNIQISNDNDFFGEKSSHSTSAETEGRALAASVEIAAGSGKSSATSISHSCSSGAWLRTLTPFYDLQAGASCSAVASYVSRVLLAGNSGTATKAAALKAQYLVTALNIYFSSKTSPGKDSNRIRAPKPIGTISALVSNVCKGPTASICSKTIDARGAFGKAANASPAVMTIGSMFNYVNAVHVKLYYPSGKFKPGVLAWYNNNQAMQGLALDAFIAINSNAVYM